MTGKLTFLQEQEKRVGLKSWVGHIRRKKTAKGFKKT